MMAADAAFESSKARRAVPERAADEVLKRWC